jgi:hypothetical protein
MGLVENQEREVEVQLKQSLSPDCCNLRRESTSDTRQAGVDVGTPMEREVLFEDRPHGPEVKPRKCIEHGLRDWIIVDVYATDPPPSSGRGGEEVFDLAVTEPPGKACDDSSAPPGESFALAPQPR